VISLQFTYNNTVMIRKKDRINTLHHFLVNEGWTKDYESLEIGMLAYKNGNYDIVYPMDKDYPGIDEIWDSICDKLCEYYHIDKVELYNNMSLSQGKTTKTNCDNTELVQMSVAMDDIVRKASSLQLAVNDFKEMKSKLCGYCNLDIDKAADDIDNIIKELTEAHIKVLKSIYNDK